MVATTKFETVLPPGSTHRPGAESSPFERRLRAEWRLLRSLAALNPGRLTGLRADDTTFYVTLEGTPALPLADGPALPQHALRVAFPRYFPAVPMELFLSAPVRHPNIHPENGFVCLWDGHRVDNTVEHALHKTAAMLGWRLMNLDARHVMQPAAVSLTSERDRLALQLAAPALLGVEHPAATFTPAGMVRRRRLL